jgi:hypothetical protein
MGKTMKTSKLFTASTERLAEAKAQKWLNCQKNFKNVTLHSAMARTSEERIVSKNESIWMTTVQYDE